MASSVISHLPPVTVWLLPQVRTLEAANKKLELQIREYYEKRAPSVSSDFTSFFATISDLRAQVYILQYDKHETQWKRYMCINKDGLKKPNICEHASVLKTYFSMICYVSHSFQMFLFALLRWSWVMFITLWHFESVKCPHNTVTIAMWSTAPQ